LDELQAAALRIKLPTLDRDNARRRIIASEYSEAFRDLPVAMPPEFSDRTSVYHQYVLETPERDGLKDFLQQKGIGTGIYYPAPLHRHQAWKTKNLPAYRLPESERYARENLAIPVSPSWKTMRWRILSLRCESTSRASVDFDCHGPSD
jgi:dTDP-4-amino-4,6-dideoxygalactose transaminase